MARRELEVRIKGSDGTVLPLVVRAMHLENPSKVNSRDAWLRHRRGNRRVLQRWLIQGRHGDYGNGISKVRLRSSQL